MGMCMCECVCVCVCVCVCDTATGESMLREVFLKVDNDMEGRYYAEIIKVYLLAACVLLILLYLKVYLYRYSRHIIYTVYTYIGLMYHMYVHIS